MCSCVNLHTAECLSFTWWCYPLLLCAVFFFIYFFDTHNPSSCKNNSQGTSSKLYSRSEQITITIDRWWWFSHLFNNAWLSLISQGMMPGSYRAGPVWGSRSACFLVTWTRTTKSGIYWDIYDESESCLPVEYSKNFMEALAGHIDKGWISTRAADGQCVCVWASNRQRESERVSERCTQHIQKKIVSSWNFGRTSIL